MDPTPASNGAGGRKVPVQVKRRAMNQAVDLDDKDEIVEYGSYHQEYRREQSERVCSSAKSH
jgi:hypothetical protein